MGQTATTEAMPIWRSDAQPALLYCLFYDTHTRTASAIAERFGLSRQAVSTEARRLKAAGIIRQEVVVRTTA
jgi:DNA-binding Lrp family transcriptional regulator